MNQVSVVVATYKRDVPLKNALDSLAGQSYQNVEIVLVNDNADDVWNEKVTAIAEAFRQENPAVNFKYIINTSNQGSAKTRNIGIQAATGKYITFLDDDDVYLPEKIEKQAEFMEKGGYDYSITDLDLFDENGRLTDRRIRSYIEDTSAESLLKYHLKHHLTGTDTMMFTGAYLEKIGGFAPIDVGDEYYLMQRAIEGGGKFGYLPGCQIKAYVHTGEGGLSSGQGKIDGENALYAYKQQFFGKIDGKTRRYIKMRHYAVIAFAEIRRRRLLPFAGNAMLSFLCSPVQCLQLLRDRSV